MITVILGILIGAIGLWLVYLAKTEKNILWWAWILFIAGAASLIMAFDVFAGSIIEHEMQAGWMGLVLFGVLAIVLFVIGWRFGVRDKVLATIPGEAQ